METNEFVFNYLRKEIQEKVNALDLDGNNLLKVSDGKGPEPPSNLIQILGLTKFEDELYEKYSFLIQLLEKNKQDEKEQELWSNFNALDLENNYEFPTENFHSLPNKFKIEALNQLSNMQIIDTKQENWLQLSEVLAQCFRSSNNDVFLSSMKIHYRIISIPSTSCDGFISILKGALILCTNNLTEYGMINSTDTFNNRIKKIMRLVLHTLNFVLKNVYHVKHKMIDEMILLFITLLNQNYKSSEVFNASSKLIDLVFIFDEQANWFKLFTCTTRIREVFVDFLAQQKLLKTILMLYYHVSSIDNINDENLKLLNHLCNCITFLLQYSDNLKYFPVQIKSNDKVSHTDLLEHMVTLMKDPHINIKTKDVLRTTLFTIFCNNPSLLVHKLLLHLIEPFRFFEKKCPFTILDTHFYVIEIISSVTCYDKDVLFNVLNKFHKPKLKMQAVHSGCVSYRTHINCPQIVIDFTINLLKKCMSNIDNHLPLKDHVTLLLHCCRNIYMSNSVSFYYVNTKRFISTLKALYEIHSQHKIPLPLDLISLLTFFFENSMNMFEMIDNEQTAKEILDAIFVTTDAKDLNALICNIANNKSGCYIIRRYHSSIVKTRLETLWSINRRDRDPQKQSHEFKVALEEFLHTMFIFTTQPKVIEVLIDYEYEDTVIEGDEDSFTLSELLEKSLSNSNSCVEEYVGLLLMKILISNVDVYLHLENDFKIKERLSQWMSKEPCETRDDTKSSPFNDICSQLRADALNSLKFAMSTDDSFGDSDTSTHTRCSSALRRRGRSPNEMKKFLGTIKEGGSDQHWMSHARRIFKTTLNEPYKVQESLISDLLELVPKSFVYRKRTLTWPPVDSVYHQLFPEDLIGTTIIVNYGLQMGLLNTAHKNEDNLNMLIKQSRTFLSYYPEEFENYDWFLGIIFLACFGDMNKCRDVLVNFSNMNITSVIWHSFSKEFDFIFHENFYTQLRIIIQENNPVTYVALENSGVPLNLLVQKWLGQCFFNILDFEEICSFIIFAVLFPPEATIFYISAIFEHIKPSLCTLSYFQSIENILEVTRLASSFRLADHITNIEKQLKQYKNVIKL